MTSEPRTTVGLKNSGRFEPPRALSSAWKSTWFATRWPGVQIPQRPPLFSEDTREEAQEINRNQNGRSVEQNCLEGLHQLLSPNSSSSPSAIATPSSSIGSSCMPGLGGLGLQQCLLSSELSQYLQEPPQGHLADSRDLADLALSPRRRALLRCLVDDYSGDSGGLLTLP